MGLALVLVTQAATTRGTDYFYYFCVSKLIALGHADQIYNLHSLSKLERALIAPLHVPHGVIPNVYPPFFALGLVPLASLPYSAGYVVWLVLNCLPLGVSLALLERYAGLDRRERIALRSAALCSLPVIIALLQGQVSLILLAALTVALLCLRSNHDAAAGLALAVVLLKPQFLVAFVLLLVLHRRWRALAGLAGGALLLVAVPILTLGWQVEGQYLHALQEAAGWGSAVGGFAPEVNRSFAGFADLLLPAPYSTASSLVLDLVAVGALTVVALRVRSIDFPFAVAVVVSLLASQHVLIHDLTLLLIPGAVMLRHRIPARWAILGVVYLTVFAGFFVAKVTPIQLATVGMAVMALVLFMHTLSDAGRLRRPEFQANVDRRRCPR